MPYIKKCDHSGALIFHLTEDEQSVRNVLSEVNSMKEEMASKLKQLDEIIQSAKGGEISGVQS